MTEKRAPYYMSGGLLREPSRCVQTDTRAIKALPEALLMLAYEEYAAQGHGDQSFERLHARGGFSLGEVVMLLADHVERLKGRPG